MTIEERLSRIENVLKKNGFLELEPEDLTMELCLEYMLQGKVKEWNKLIKVQQRTRRYASASVTRSSDS